ncbi:dTDP-4-dehydrorhamnose 3,5-epimerase [Gammaproteobacteria bacterium]
MPFSFERLRIPEVVAIRPRVFPDGRGFFLETYKYSDFAGSGITEHFVQDNHSKSVKGVLRGLHYQKVPKAQGKLVRCLVGRIFDVALDIRRGSSSFGQWVGLELSGEDQQMLYVPAGFAHGFLVMSAVAEVEYKCTDEYSQVHERGIIWNDPEIGIRWPDVNPMLSEKDLILPLLKDADINYDY